MGVGARSHQSVRDADIKASSALKFFAEHHGRLENTAGGGGWIPDHYNNPDGHFLQVCRRGGQGHCPQRPTERSDPTQRREEWVTVQGPVKEQQPDGMSHGGVYHSSLHEVCSQYIWWKKKWTVFSAQKRFGAFGPAHWHHDWGGWRLAYCLLASTSLRF